MDPVPDPPTTPLLATSAVLLVLFTAIASLDGLYLHLYRYRLYRRPASRREHWLHTANALLFPPLCYLLYCAQPSGAYLWLATSLAVATLAIEIADVRCEHASRADLGGLGRNEYLLHFLMSGLRAGAIVPLLASAPAEAWALEQTRLQPQPVWLALVGWCVGLPAVGTAVLHLVLALRPLPSAPGQPSPTAS